MFDIECCIAPASAVARVRCALVAAARGVRALLRDHSQALASASKAALPRQRLTELRAMYTAVRRANDDSEEIRSGAALQGQMLRLTERREVAIYLSGNAPWVADFIDGHGEIVDAATWLRFNCGTVKSRHSLRRMRRESAVPLSAQLAARIERLHHGMAKVAASLDDGDTR